MDQLDLSYEQCLRDLDLFETTKGDEQRDHALTKLSKIIGQWSDGISRNKGVPHNLIASTTAKVFLFGSTRLGVHDPTADLDVVCVLPNHITRNHFFGTLPSILKSTSGVTEFKTIPDAYVPVLRFCLDGLEIDMLCCQLGNSMVPPNLESLDISFVAGLDEKSRISINGCRVSSSLLSLVPNIPNFKMALRGIRKWAKVRGVYSNAMGFLGGISWAILTARVCQQYPRASPANIVIQFFKFMAKWDWPKPVCLNPIKEDGPLTKKVWNPNIGGPHVAPVITDRKSVV